MMALVADRALETIPREPDHDLVVRVAGALVGAGRVVPGLTVDDQGRGRSWWWPLPAASDRSLIASLVVDPSPAGQQLAASHLAVAVDTIVRDHLSAAKVALAPKRPGRPTVTEAWARSLVATDPWLSPSVDGVKLDALAEEVDAWVRSGAVLGGRFRLCLRVCEPTRADDWTIELLAQDRDEPSLMLSLGEVWAGRTPFGGSVMEDTLASLGRLVRLAPELAGVLDELAPTEIDVAGEDVVRLLRDRGATLDDAGIGVLLPSWWSQRPRVGLRARAKRAASSSSSSASAAGLGMDELVQFTWEAALEGQRLSKADLAMLARAAKAKRSIVQLRGQWVEVDAAGVAALLAGAGTVGEATAGELVRAGLGLDALGLSDDVELVGVNAAAVPWLSSLLDDALHATVAPIPTPPGFEGSLRPYQERGTGWLTFLGRLGLGACLADDMGLGKTAQLIAAVLADATDAPALVVCPVSVLGNWERELARFAPSLSVLVHHGADRHTADVPFAERWLTTSSSRPTRSWRATCQPSAPSSGADSSWTKPNRSRTRARPRPRPCDSSAPDAEWPSPALRSRTASASCGRSCRY